MSYADDIIIMADTEEGMRGMLRKISKIYRKKRTGHEYREDKNSVF